MKKIDVLITYDAYQSIEELSPQDQQLVEISRQMTFQAYAPYSQFWVGAAVLLENGQIIKGSNQENAAYPSGLCAERVAIFSASAQFPDQKIIAVAVSAKNPNKPMDHPVSPCGGCRQTLLEYKLKQNQPIVMLLSGESGSIYKITQIKDLLPVYFKSEKF
jgi:cytidine deaminase